MTDKKAKVKRVVKAGCQAKKKTHKRARGPGVRRPQKQRKSKAKYIDDPTEPDRCHAACATKPGRCGNPSVTGFKVCRWHGGKSTGRPITHGAFSRSLSKWAKPYEEALANEEQLYDLKETLAFSHMVLERAALRAEAADTPGMRKEALGLIEDVMTPGAEPVTVAKRLTSLHDLLKRGADEDKTLEVFTKAIEAFAVRKEQAWGVRLKAMHAMNERDLVVVFTRFIDVTIELFGAEDARRLTHRLSKEGVLARLESPREQAGEHGPGSV